MTDSAQSAHARVGHRDARGQRGTQQARPCPVPELKVDADAATVARGERAHLRHLHDQPRRGRDRGDDKHAPVRAAHQEGAAERDEEGGRRHRGAPRAVPQGDRRPQEEAR